jgi:N-acyl homoserine lactone hydrolase
MKKIYRIYPILTSQIIMDKGIFTYLKNHGEKILVPIWAWLIEGGEEPILVDTGCSLQEFMKYSVLSAGGEEGAPIEDSLQKLGISVSDVKTIIITHLHSDHCLNAKKFPHAKLIVQQEELKFARNPHPLFSAIYKNEWYEGLNFKTVQGDSEIISGVKAVFTPGHSAGSQSVSITTEKGEVVITGFCAIDDNFTDKGDIIPAPHIDPIKAYESIMKVRKLADIITPLHSQRTLNVKSIP